MMKPNEMVLRTIQAYDEKLYFKWNNAEFVWEVWRKMPWGNRLITPITKNIYHVGAERVFAPIDYRIVDWIYYADSQRKDLHRSWKFRKDRTIKNREDSKWKKYKTKLKELANENYYLINNELIGQQCNNNQSEWKRPEVQSKSRERIMYRKEYYDGNTDN